jgi:hypothetical protein
MIALPKCRHCHRTWKPRLGIVANKAYCRRCRNQRREVAKRVFGLRPLTTEELDRKYVLPRKLREMGLS